MGEKYNGWANYPTWATGSWLSSDEEYYLRWVELADSLTLAEFEDQLREWLRDLYLPHLEPASMITDIIGWGIEQIDWREVQNSLRDDDSPV